MNFKEFAEKLGLEYDEYMEIAGIFLETSASNLSKLQTAINKENAQDVFNAAHSIKGSAGNMGFMEIFEVAKELEMKAYNNNLKGAAEVLQILRNMLDEISKNIRISG